MCAIFTFKKKKGLYRFRLALNSQSCLSDLLTAEIKEYTVMPTYDYF